jgi:predicted RNA-binding Zn ribbon-like protein
VNSLRFRLTLEFPFLTYNQCFTGSIGGQPLKRALQVVIEPHTFSAGDLVGGDPALDFVNTVVGRDQAPRDWLDTYERLIEWAALVKLFPMDILQRLTKEATREPAAAMSALTRAKTLREQLFALLTNTINGKYPSTDALRLLRQHWLAGVNSFELRFKGGRLVKEFGEEVDFDSITRLIGYRIVENVLTSPMERFRKCQGPNCSWLFIDTSKGGRRRWCDMAVCGSAAKSRRFYARTTGASGDS